MRSRFFLLLAVAISFVIGCNKSDPVSPDEPEATEPITVMTWNVYVGTDVDRVIGAPSAAEIPIRAAEAFQLLQATNFPERAQTIAAQIAQFKPHLVGLQEIAIVRTQSPGDAVVGGTTPAEDVLLDYLEILTGALNAQGVNYTVAALIENSDAEIPAIVSTDPLQFMDVRLTDFDVVLARDDVQVSRVSEVSYQTSFSVQSLGLEIKRGYVALDAQVGETKYRFVNTHLEQASSGVEIQLAQAQELIDALDGETLPIILLGDLNTKATTGDTYTLLESNGFVDIWPLNSATDNPNGFTSPHAADLLNEEINFHQRIDFIFARSDTEIFSVVSNVVGDELADRTSSGMWPSDHAGVVAELRFRL